MSLMPEKEYQKEFAERLRNDDGYEIRKAPNYDPKACVDAELTMRFLWKNYSGEMTRLEKRYGQNLQDRVVEAIEASVQRNGSRIDAMNAGIEIDGHRFRLYFPKPQTNFNPKATSGYESNVFSVMRETRASETEILDEAIFVNGILIFGFELKSNPAGQDVKDAEAQYRTRNPKTPTFTPNTGAIAFFAMDLDEVSMTTTLAKENTNFVPFNLGNGDGPEKGAGNPKIPGKLSVSYMWETVLKKDMVLDLLDSFVYVETNGSEFRTIFPRLHQLIEVTSAIELVMTNKNAVRLLFADFMGSGKTNSIAWLATKLATLHRPDGTPAYDTVIVATDRLSNNDQLGRAIGKLIKTPGVATILDESSPSSSLEEALKKGSKLIATTLQKFLYVSGRIANMKSRRFAVILDEAHSSTSGKNMEAVLQTLSQEEETHRNVEEWLENRLRTNKDEDNVSVFAFTGTPKAVTLKLFGLKDEKGRFVPFSAYTMKQSIEEAFTLNPLENYVEYATICRLEKKEGVDPFVNPALTKVRIKEKMGTQDESIGQIAEIIARISKRRAFVLCDGKGKVMVVCATRKQAVMLFLALKAYVAKHGDCGLKPCVAFTDKIHVEKLDKEVTEAELNGFPSKVLPKKFDSDEYNVLVVADKYQYGFDQPKLCGMFILKQLNGTNAVQTLTRVNRPYSNKKTFIVDFVNTCEDMVEAFAPYYAGTISSDGLNPSELKDAEKALDDYGVFEESDVDRFAELLFMQDSGKITTSERVEAAQILKRSVDEIESRKKGERKEIRAWMKRFAKLYELLALGTKFGDAGVVRKYLFIEDLLKYLETTGRMPKGTDVSELISMSDFSQRMVRETEMPEMFASPTLSSQNRVGIAVRHDSTERLSELIREMNERMGTNVDESKTFEKTIREIFSTMTTSQELKEMAKSNSRQDIELNLKEKLKKLLAELYDENRESIRTLINDEEAKTELAKLAAEALWSETRRESESRIA